MDNNTPILATEFKQNPAYIENVVLLIDEGNTIPFIARYRKEMHGTMDDQLLREIADRLQYLRNLDQRRAEIISTVESQGKMTAQLQTAIYATKTLAELEDLYRPYKAKRRTRATIAKEKGLEPLALILYAQVTRKGTIEELAEAYINPEKGVETLQDALNGASDIIAETISDNADIRKELKALFTKFALLTAKKSTDGESVYDMYAEYSESLHKVQSHRILAVNRGEKEGILSVSIQMDAESATKVIKRKIIRPGSISSEFVSDAADDAYSRLIFPSVEREMRSMLTDLAAEQAIKMFGLNLKPLLMQPPVRNKVTLGFDPAYRTGCKIAVVDGTGKALETGVVYPTPPYNKKAEATATLKRMIQKHKVEVIAIGNGTASKESEIFIADLIKDLPGVAYMVVNEAGASVYSASKLGAEEFPDFDVSLRSAVSIARRLQDPLAELVKIDPKSIGVGQYQHDMPPARLDESLDGVVEDCVNAVGVDLNTASVSLLSRVSGLSTSTAKNIVQYREQNGIFSERRKILDVPKIGPKAFEQCAGFLRVPESKNILDRTGVHPESYAAAKIILETCGYTPQDATSGNVADLQKQCEKIGFEKIAVNAGIGVPTVKDIIRELIKPGRDPRDELPETLLRTDVMDMNDLKPGMTLRGTVRNVIDFGVFVDIGVHQDGLVHISELSNRFVRHPSEVVKVGDIVDTVVLSVDATKKRIALSMKQAQNN